MSLEIPTLVTRKMNEQKLTKTKKILPQEWIQVCAVFVILVVFEEGFAGVNTLGWVRKLAGIILSLRLLLMLHIIRANNKMQHR